jgi:hypothetical protein
MRRAIALEDTARFEAIPGIGRKTAQRVILEDPSRLGERDRPPEAVEQSSAEPALQLADVLGERGLAQVQAVGRTSEAPGLRHRQEDLELAHRRIHKPCLIARIRTLYWYLCKPRAYGWRSRGAARVLIQVFRHGGSPWSPRVTRH